MSQGYRIPAETKAGITPPGPGQLGRWDKHGIGDTDTRPVEIAGMVRKPSIWEGLVATLEGLSPDRPWAGLPSAIALRPTQELVHYASELYTVSESCIVIVQQ